MSIEIQGLNQLLQSLDITNPAKIDAALTKACALVERSAKMKAPKGNGELARSITSKQENGVGEVFTTLEYAPYVEYGTGLFAEEGGRKDVPWHYQDDKGEWHTTSGQHPQPFMRPALDENRDEIVRIFREVIKDD